MGAGYSRVAGIDEVGRGSLAGPVIAAAVILDRRMAVDGIDDSKRLPPARREAVARRILETALAVGVGASPSEEVDGVNVLKATILAMRRAVQAIEPPPDALLIDALRLPGFEGAQSGIVGGDRLSYSIAAASIVAKVLRDGVMRYYSGHYPAFDFASNKGYGTAAHLEALGRFGPCPIHRMTFRGVRAEGALAFS